MIDIEWWVYLVVLIGLAALTYLLHRVVREVAPEGSDASVHGLAALYLGVDGRASTSKLQALLWTYAILWALLSVLVGAGPADFGDVVGEEVREEYFLLLGGPYLVAIGAKAKTSHDVTAAKAKGITDPKPGKKAPAGAAAAPLGERSKQRLAEVVTGDDGAIDLGDFQYFAFTLVTLAYFVTALLGSPEDGLPPIPGTLLVLMGVSQAAYLGKKVLLPASPADASGAGVGRRDPAPTAAAARPGPSEPTAGP